MAKRYHWNMIKAKGEDFPEAFFTKLPNGEELKIEQNGYGSLIKIQLSGLDRSVQSVISNGVILREKDLRSGRSIDLEDTFRGLRNEISSLPNNRILRNIGGNYGIMTEFIGNAQYVHKKPALTINSMEDVFKLFTRFASRIRQIPRQIYERVIEAWRKKSFLPGFWDVFDLALFGSAGLAVYLLNFNLLHAGFITALGAFLAGFMDFLWRRRNLYMTKIVALLGPSLYAIYLGLQYQ